MIFQALINMFIILIGAVLSWLPVVTKLPAVNGYDIDTALVQGMGFFYSVETNIWPLGIVFAGFIFLIGYYTLKMVLKFFLGHRAPGLH